MSKNCCIYKGSRADQTYLYVAADEGVERVPSSLLVTLGELSLVMELALHAGRKLARADVNKVLESIENQGFYLQVPPREGEPEATLFPALREYIERSE